MLLHLHFVIVHQLVNNGTYIDLLLMRALYTAAAGGKAFNFLKMKRFQNFLNNSVKTSNPITKNTYTCMIEMFELCYEFKRKH